MPANSESQSSPPTSAMHRTMTLYEIYQEQRSQLRSRTVSEPEESKPNQEEEKQPHQPNQPEPTDPTEGGLGQTGGGSETK